MDRVSPARRAGPSPLRSSKSSSVSQSPQTNGSVYSSLSLDHPGGFMSNFLSDVRDTEESHLAALAAADAEHKRVRDSAMLVYRLHEQSKERERLLEAQIREEKRLRNEEALAVEAGRLQDLQTKEIPRPSRPPIPQPKPKAESSAPKPQLNGVNVVNGVNGSLVKPLIVPPNKEQQPALHLGQATSSRQTELPRAQQQNGLAKASPFGHSTPAQLPAQQQKSAPTQAPAQGQVRASTPDRYVEIHQDLKKLRKLVEDQSKAPGSPLKTRVGEMRRDIRKSIGQLTGQKRANTQPTHKILNTLRESLTPQLPSVPVAVESFVREPRELPAGITHDDSKLPSLFLYLVSIFSKAIVSQFINECGANPKAADPIGIVTASIFSQPEFQWRGGSLIDILMAKFRVVCPVLFGFRGSDKTERGRFAIGWRRDGASWMPEQMHKDRMTGLGAGFASIALRDFSRVQKVNPYPPPNYWRAMAFIVNSPPNEISDTQYVVLKAMIEGFEKRVLDFYGNAGFEALRLALVEFPQRAPTKSPAAGALAVLGDLLKRDIGLDLSQ